MKDEAGTMYNIEMQTVSRDDLLRRIRYYQGTMDRRALESGKDYRELPDSFIIFVCAFDYFDGGLAAYRRKTVLEGREEASYMTMQMLMADERRAAREDTEKRIVVRMCRRGKTVEDIAQDTDILMEAVRGILKAEGLLG